MELEVTGLDHLYLAVSNIERSEAFYDRVMSVLGYRKGTLPIGGERHAHYFNHGMQVSIRPARTTGRPHDPYAPGLHHPCLRVADRRSVDAAVRALRAFGVDVTEPPPLPRVRRGLLRRVLHRPGRPAPRGDRESPRARRDPRALGRAHRLRRPAAKTPRSRPPLTAADRGF